MGKNKINDDGYVIVRGDRSGVFFGQLASRNGQEVELLKDEIEAGKVMVIR